MNKVCFFILYFILEGCGSQGTSKSENQGENFCDYLQESSLALAIYNCQGSKIPDQEVNSSTVAWLTLDSRDANHIKFNGIARVGNCTGALIETGGTGQAPAYLLTAAHCIEYQGGYFPPQGVFFDISVSPLSVYFNYYADLILEDNLMTEVVKKVKYATMDNQDIALLELDTTLVTLKEKGIHAYKISESLPQEGNLVKLIGVPITGVSQLGIRKAVCRFGKKVSLREKDFSFSHSYRHHCSSVGGSSGSPLFDFYSSEIIAVNNTAVNDTSLGQEPCSLNRPCEVQDGENKVVAIEENYAQVANLFANCFDSNGFFSEELETCSLSN